MDTSNWKTININTIFDISYGNKLDMCQMMPSKNGIPFVTRTGTNNGVGGYVEILSNETSNKSGSLSIALGGSIGSTFLQSKEFYTSQNVAVLQPKHNISNNIKIFLAHLIERECQMKFCAFGRELNKHIKVDFTIKLPIDNNGNPDWQWIEEYVKKNLVPKLPDKSKSIWERKFDTKPLSNNRLQLKTKEWKWFKYTKLFNIKGSITTPKIELEESGFGLWPYVTTQAINNGIEGFYNIKTEKGNILTVDSAVLGYCAYQENDFSASDHVEELIPKFHLTPYTAMFLTTIINKEQYRYNYGRKCSQTKLKKSQIKLPAILNAQGEYEPDWQWMEDYIKGLPYSRCL